MISDFYVTTLNATFGALPIITFGGTFVINGSGRVVFNIKANSCKTASTELLYYQKKNNIFTKNHEKKHIQFGNNKNKY